MEDTTKKQAEQAHTTETPGSETPTPEEKSDRDELKEVSQQLFRTLSSWGTPGEDIGAYAAGIPRTYRERWARIHSWAGDVCTRTCRQFGEYCGRGKKGCGEGRVDVLAPRIFQENFFWEWLQVRFEPLQQQCIYMCRTQTDV